VVAVEKKSRYEFAVSFQGNRGAFSISYALLTLRTHIRASTLSSAVANKAKLNNAIMPKTSRDAPGRFRCSEPSERKEVRNVGGGRKGVSKSMTRATLEVSESNFESLQARSGSVSGRSKVVIEATALPPSRSGLQLVC
jgi:hypothetical protein